MGKLFIREIVEIVLSDFHKCVNESKFYIYERPENIDFITEYALTDRLQADILLSIRVEDYFDTEEDDKFPCSYVHFFAPELRLITSDDESTIVNMYIKITIRERDDGQFAYVISFHHLNYPVTYPFR